LFGGNVRYTFQNEESTNGQKLPFQLSKSNLPTRSFMRYVSQHRLTAQAGGVDPFAVGIQPWLREPRDDDGLAWVSQTRMCFLANKNGLL